MSERIVMHIDVNNAFLSWTAVYLLKNNHPIDIRKTYAVIGGDEEARKGVVLAKSIPCKEKGIVTGESLYTARRKCPNLKSYPPNFEIYQNYSNLMYNYLLKYSPYIERYSIDECFIEYTSSKKLFGDPIKLAYKIKEDIKNKFGFTVNIGIGNNKLQAKMASDFTKPDKVHTLFDNEIKDKLWPLPIEDLFMIGKSTSKKLRELNINTIKDLANTDINKLTTYFKSHGKTMWEYANGIDNSPVEYEESEAKSISSSTVLPFNTNDINYIKTILKELSMQTGKRLRDNNLYAQNVHIWIKYNNFNKYSKQEKYNISFNNDIDIYKNAYNLFIKLWNKEKIRALCVGVSDLTKSNNVQLDLFSKNTNSVKTDKLQKVLDDINKKYNKNIITYADVKKNKNN